MKIIQYPHKLFLILILLSLLTSCSQKTGDTEPVEIVEMKGYVLAKEMNTKKILVVPNIDRTVVERITKGELEALIIAQDNGGVNFYVSIETLESMNVGDQVLVKYDKFGDVEESDPPNRVAISVE